ncbi:MAG: hypothetical protein EPN58_11305 [Rhodanobacter sp.]|nr:MAG: hypothetical protein EPN58_11305 [Rhodanobacter sp.]
MTELISEYHRQGLTAPEIAERIDRSVGRVRILLHQSGKTLNLPADRAQAAKRRHDIQSALSAEPHLTTRALAERLGLPQVYVSRIRRQLGQAALRRSATAQIRRSHVALDMLAGRTTREMADAYGVSIHVIQCDRRAIQAGQA